MTAPFDIVAPLGAFSNHLRWLLLLDPVFKFSFVPTVEYYNIFAGSDWPTYQNYCQSDFTNIKSEILEEIKNLQQEHFLLGLHEYVTPEEKINFITDHIYNESRSWHNWLTMDWKYRTRFDQLIPLSHYPTSQNNKTIGLTMPPDLALKRYLKFNSSLNGATIPVFLKDVDDCNSALSTNPNTRSWAADQLFSENLDPTIDAEMVSWVGLSDWYTEANYIHQLWFNLHKKAEKEFVRYVNNLYQ